MEKLSRESVNATYETFLSSLHNNQKLTVLRVVLLIASLISVVFTVLNHLQGNISLAVILALESIIYLSLLYLIIRSHKFLKSVSLIFILCFFLVCIFFYYSPQVHITVFTWSIVCYFLAQFFLGSKLGSIISIIFFVATYLLLLKRYFLNPGIKSITILSHLAVVNLGALIFSVYYEKRREKAEKALRNANQELEMMANRDSLTGLFNRRCFDQVLLNEWLRLKRNKCPLSLILSDIDYFKKYNDYYGHVAGDACLQSVADAFKVSVRRATDIAARYGGEEFAIILPDTDSEGAKIIAQLIMDAIKNKAIPHKGSLIKNTVSMSFGIATVTPNDSLDCESFIEMADKALYQSKEQGRNMISIG